MSEHALPGMRGLKKLSDLMARMLRPADPPVAENPESRFAAEMLRTMSLTPWCVDTIEVSDCAVVIQGWALAPDGEYAAVDFRVNGRPFEQVVFPIGRPDIAGIFWFAPGADRTGFRCQTRLAPEDRSAGELRFDYVRRGSGEPLYSWHSCHFDLRAERMPLPAAVNRKRVHGGTDEGAFRLEGFSTFRKLEAVLQSRFGRGYRDFPSILDWGCGCGRSTRYFELEAGQRLVGIDIDGGNVHWCRQNLPFGEFRQVPLLPPTALADASFDLLIGVSIFTHLRQREEGLWLAELSRIARPGAVALMSVHGDATLCRATLSEAAVRLLREHGFMDAGGNPDLDGAVAEGSEYYRNSFHTPDYIRKVWTRYFEVLDIVPGVVGNHQDVVVLTKR